MVVASLCAGADRDATVRHGKLDEYGISTAPEKADSPPAATARVRPAPMRGTHS